MDPIVGKAIELILRVYKDAYEDYTEEGPDGIAFEGIVIEDELYEDICDFVETELKQFMEETEDDGSDAESVSEAECINEADGQG